MAYTYFQLEAMNGQSEATMTAAGYAPNPDLTIQMDEQERTGKGVQLTKISGLGLAPVSITATPSNKGGSVVRHVRKLERNLDLVLNIRADGRVERESMADKLYSILEGECILRRCNGSPTGLTLPASYSYLRVYFAGGGTFSLGDGDTTDKEVELVITLRAHKPDWKRAN